jgi:di/tricarboxylate transporter
MGTSTNLIVHGLLLNANLPGFSFLHLGIVGLPITFIGLLYLVTLGYHLLPDIRATTKEDLIVMALTLFIVYGIWIS